MLMKIAFAFTFIGIVLFSYSLQMEPFTDVDLFMKNYMELASGQSDKFYLLRENMLTSKYKLQDIGITLILLPLSITILLKLGRGNILSPPNKNLTILLAILLPVITISGFVFDLLQASQRNEFPHWADSLGAAFIGIPFLFIILLIWSVAHLSFAKNVIARPITNAISFKLNPWLKLISVITAILSILSLLQGHYWYAFPSLLWLYYYLSVGINYMKPLNT